MSVEGQQSTLTSQLFLNCEKVKIDNSKDLSFHYELINQLQADLEKLKTENYTKAGETKILRNKIEHLLAENTRLTSLLKDKDQEQLVAVKKACREHKEHIEKLQTQLIFTTKEMEELANRSKILNKLVKTRQQLFFDPLPCVLPGNGWDLGFLKEVDPYINVYRQERTAYNDPGKYGKCIFSFENSGVTDDYCLKQKRSYGTPQEKDFLSKSIYRCCSDISNSSLYLFMEVLFREPLLYADHLNILPQDYATDDLCATWKLNMLANNTNVPSNFLIFNANLNYSELICKSIEFLLNNDLEGYFYLLLIITHNLKSCLEFLQYFFARNATITPNQNMLEKHAVKDKVREELLYNLRFLERELYKFKDLIDNLTLVREKVLEEWCAFYKYYENCNNGFNSDDTVPDKPMLIILFDIIKVLENIEMSYEEVPKVFLGIKLVEKKIFEIFESLVAHTHYQLRPSLESPEVFNWENKYYALKVYFTKYLMDILPSILSVKGLKKLTTLERGSSLLKDVNSALYHGIHSKLPFLRFLTQLAASRSFVQEVFSHQLASGCFFEQILSLLTVKVHADSKLNLAATLLHLAAIRVVSVALTKKCFMTSKNSKEGENGQCGCQCKTLFLITYSLKDYITYQFLWNDDVYNNTVKKQFIKEAITLWHGLCFNLLTSDLGILSQIKKFKHVSEALGRKILLFLVPEKLDKDVEENDKECVGLVQEILEFINDFDGSTKANTT
ncbi:hypothetical protein Zmor_011867 [Zophobas morio]|uniref:Uncharacterized protein n=1 Tax=Zophobas morio TaxID=2755281 RepID=A0AA38HKS6_9CUCU|nr:hypothetical protein Zmor_011867 [Zophobas morio]